MLNTIPPTKDRNYYRMFDDEELLHFVRYAPRDRINWEELALVLAERLREAGLKTDRTYNSPDL